MAGELYNYLSTDTADYTTTTLSVAPVEVMPVVGGYRQTKIEYDSADIQVITHGSAARLEVGCRFSPVSAADIATIWDMYMDPAKAYGQARTFKWQSPNIWPVSNYVYVARFVSPSIEALIKQIKALSELRLYLHGYYAP